MSEDLVKDESEFDQELIQLEELVYQRHQHSKTYGGAVASKLNHIDFLGHTKLADESSIDAPSKSLI